MRVQGNIRSLVLGPYSLGPIWESERKELLGKMSGNGFKKLEIWQKGKNLAVEIYKMTAEGAISGDFGLRDQI